MICGECNMDYFSHKGQEICPGCGTTVTRTYGRNPLVDKVIPKTCSKCGVSSEDEFLLHQGRGRFHCPKHVEYDTEPEAELGDWLMYGVLVARSLEASQEDGETNQNGKDT